MKIEDSINPYDVGVVIGRFQLHELHEGHCNLIKEVVDRHFRVFVLLGVSPIKNSKNNPLDFNTRREMILEAFPMVEVHPLFDNRSDDAWSKNVDNTICTWLNPQQKAVLYGSRDSFIGHYHGKFSTQIIEPRIEISATSIRNGIIAKYKNTADYRAGLIAATGQRYPTVYPAVDIAVIDKTGMTLMLGRKHAETKYRFIGGFTDPTDESFEHAAKRELIEEAGIDLETANMTYVGSMQVDDWRYRKEQDKIFTNFFSCERLYGLAKASDDIAEIKWFDILNLKKLYKDVIVEEHHKLFHMLVNKNFI